MEQNNNSRLPHYVGNGVAVWVNLDKNGNKYLSIKILDSLFIKAWKNEPKPRQQGNNDNEA